MDSSDEEDPDDLTSMMSTLAVSYLEVTHEST